MNLSFQIMKYNVLFLYKYIYIKYRHVNDCPVYTSKQCSGPPFLLSWVYLDIKPRALHPRGALYTQLYPQHSAEALEYPRNVFRILVSRPHFKPTKTEFLNI